MHIDDVNITVSVSLTYVVTLGLYNGPISKKLLIEHIEKTFEGIEPTEFISKVEIIDMTTEDGVPLIEGAFRK